MEECSGPQSILNRTVIIIFIKNLFCSLNTVSQNTTNSFRTKKLIEANCNYRFSWMESYKKYFLSVLICWELTLDFWDWSLCYSDFLAIFHSLVTTFENFICYCSNKYNLMLLLTGANSRACSVVFLVDLKHSFTFWE